MIKTDYHLHSEYSVDSKAKLVDICEAAIADGMEEIVITDHMDIHIQDCAYFDVDERQKEIDEMNKKYEGKLVIKCGMELGHPYFNETFYKSLPLDRYDFIIGSVHNMSDDTDLNDLDYATIDVYQLMKDYVSELMRLVDYGGFDVLGHITLPLNFFYRYRDDEIDMSKIVPYYRPLFEKIIPMGIGIEVNSSGKRKFVKDFYPNADVLALYKEMGGYLITVGADAHCPEHQALCFEELAILLKQIGFDEISTYTKRKRSTYKF